LYILDRHAVHTLKYPHLLLLLALIGAVGGIFVVFSISTLDKVFKIDDPVGAISVHGVVGLWGLLAVPLTNPDVLFTGQLLRTQGTRCIWSCGNRNQTS
jgi:Amt family ammonium transporter